MCYLTGKMADVVKLTILKWEMTPDYLELGGRVITKVLIRGRQEGLSRVREGGVTTEAGVAGTLGDATRLTLKMEEWNTTNQCRWLLEAEKGKALEETVSPQSI